MKKIKPAIYNEFIRQANLVKIQIKKASMEIFEENLPKDYSVLNKIDDNVQLLDIKKKYFRVTHTFRYKMVDEKNPDISIARIRFTLMLTYSSDKLISKDIFSIFKVMNVPLNSWSYAREFIHSNIMRLGLPPVFLPLFKQP